MKQEDLRYLDSSKMKCYLECPRKFYWRYVRHLVPQKDETPLTFGSAIHEALYTWYDMQLDGYSKEEAMEEALHRFHSNWTDQPYDDKRTHEKGDKLLKGYFKKYPEEPFTFLTPPETAFKIKFYDYFLIGRFDGVINHNGMVMPLDHKTSTRMGNYYFNRFRPDLQMTKYCWVARKIAQKLGLNEEIHGAYINVLYFTKTKMNYVRQIVSREQWEIDQFTRIALHIMDEINAKSVDRMEDWFPNWTSCTKWGSCTYRDLCIDNEPERLIDFMFEEEVWNPLDGNDNVINIDEEDLNEHL